MDNPSGNRISIDTYNLFCKYGSELLWIDDPIRQPRPNGTNSKTDNEFIILAKLDENLELFYNNYYSNKLKMEFDKKIKSLEIKVVPEVFVTIKNKYNKTCHNKELW
jgi:hypothetical protein